MSGWLQFNDARGGHFAADFSDRYFINNRKGLVIVSPDLTFGSWLDRTLEAPIGFFSMAAMVTAIARGYFCNAHIIPVGKTATVTADRFLHAGSGGNDQRQSGSGT